LLLLALTSMLRASSFKDGSAFSACCTAETGGFGFTEAMSELPDEPVEPVVALVVSVDVRLELPGLVLALP
jgi:hypothetical protein